ncbi:MAG: NUDIX domain-containing protein [Patescibacteria group bacterium]
MKVGINYIGITTPFYCNDGNGNFLLHKRSKNCRDEQGMWDPGSGEADFGMRIEENVLREVMEEYGCKGEIIERLPAHDIFRENNGVKTHWIAIPFFIKVNPEEVKNNDPDKIDEIGWFKLDNLPEPIHTGFATTFNAFKDYFEKYKRE